jgi:hypothetical protein
MRSLGLLLAVVSLAGSCQTSQVSSSIGFTHMTTLGADSGEAEFSSEPSSMARDSRGRLYLATPFRGSEQPFVFGADGKLIRRLGVTGSGPGEFRLAEAILVTPHDSVYVLDRAQLRLSVFDSDLSFVRQVTIPPFQRAALTAAGRMIVSGIDPRSQTFPYSMRRMEPGDSFGPPFGHVNTPCSPANCGSSDPRVLSPGLSGGIVAAWRAFEYRVEWWDDEQRLARDLRPKSQWFLPYQELQIPAPDSPPQPIIFAVGEDSAGRVWVLGQVAKVDWREKLGAVRQVEGQRVHAGSGRLYDGIVEVLDAQSGQPLAQSRIPDTPRFWLGQGVLGIVRYAEDGRILVDVVQAVYRPD